MEREYCSTGGNDRAVEKRLEVIVAEEPVSYGTKKRE